jgi:hypothetical protein
MTTTKSPTEFELNPDAEPLTTEELKAAVEDGKHYTYREIVRSMSDPPIVGQSMANVSYMLFRTPREMKSGKPLYGYLKVRGAFIDEDAAKKGALNTIRDVDSKFQVRTAPMGMWVPITEDDSKVRDMLDVPAGTSEKDKREQLRDEAVKEKEAERRRIAREIREREEECRNNDIYNDVESLTFYAMKRVTEMRLTEEIQNKIKQLESVRKSLIDTRNLLKGLEEKYPTYSDLWIDRYNEERKKGGVPEFVPAEDQFASYQKHVVAPYAELNIVPY